MTLFDFTFGLSAIILGLGLAEMASRFQQLVFAGRRARWAPEPALLSILIFFVIMVLWLSSWRQRDMHTTTIGAVAFQVASLLLPYMVAAAVWPRVPEEGEIDLHAYYDRARLFLFGVLLVGQLANWIGNVILYAGPISGVVAWASLLARTAPYYDLIPYAALMFVRWRWFNILALLFVLAVFVPQVVTFRLTG